MESIGILGAGTWGMALARVLSNKGYPVTVWSAIEKEVNDFSRNRVHPNLPGMCIPVEIDFTSEISEACKDKDILLFAVPSAFVRGTAAKAAPYISDGQIIVNVAKGIEYDTRYTMTEVIQDELSQFEQCVHVNLVAMSGPTHAEEVASDMPTAIVSACENLTIAEKMQNIFSDTCMRVYTNIDVRGIEFCGALKNIIALSVGISTGLGYGDNARAALITRGMAEIAKLGIAIGCMEQSFYGLAGIGDLIVTATSVHSRNNKVGFLIGQGEKPEEAIKSIGMVVEGVNALPAAMKLAKQYQIEMPITFAVNEIINQNANPSEIVEKLMGRAKKTELPKSILDIKYENVVLKGKRGIGMKRVITYGTFDLLRTYQSVETGKGIGRLSGSCHFYR